MPKLIDAKGINGIDSIGDKHKNDNESIDDGNDDTNSNDSNDDNESDNKHNDGDMGDSHDKNDKNTPNPLTQLKWLIKPTTFTSEEEIKN